MPARPIILDANILIRFVLGEKVPALLTAHAATIDFLAPDTAFEEARKHLPTILRARGDDGTGEAAALDELDAVTAIVTPVPVSSYEPMRAPALARIGQRDPHDWQVLACAEVCASHGESPETIGLVANDIENMPCQKPIRCVFDGMAFQIPSPGQVGVPD